MAKYDNSLAQHSDKLLWKVLSGNYGIQDSVANTSQTKYTSQTPLTSIQLSFNKYIYVGYDDHI